MAAKPNARLDTITFENSRLIFKNFSGEPTKLNRAGGVRGFNLVLSEEEYESMLRDGWNVKRRDPREEGDDPLFHLPVKVSFGGRPPTIVLITSSGRTFLDEETVGILDKQIAVNVDLIIRPYHWDVNGTTGVSAYLQTMYFTMEEDDLQRKYGLVEAVLPTQTEDAPPWGN